MSDEEEVKRLQAENAELRAANLKTLDDRADRVPANFVQLTRPAMKEISILSRTNPVAVEILFLFGQKMNRQNAIMISQKALASLTGKTRQTISSALRTLEEGRWVKKLKVGTSNAYVINSQVFWTGKTQNRRYAEFTAAIITTEEEQDMTAEEWMSLETKHFPMISRTGDERILIGDETMPPPDQTDMDLN